MAQIDTRLTRYSTAISAIGVPCLTGSPDMQRRTMRGWFEYLDDARRELTESEFMALMLLNIREYARVMLEQTTQARAAAEHTEGMVGAIDDLLGRWTAMQGIPYAGSATVRAALDEQRDTHRRLAEQARREPKP